MSVFLFIFLSVCLSLSLCPHSDSLSVCLSVQNYKELELLRLVYYGGVEHEIRKEVWPFLLGHYKFGMGKKDMTQVRRRVA